MLKRVFLRYEKDETIINVFMDAYNENSSQAMKILFYLRDKEKGLGERRVFRVIIKHLASMNSSYLASNIHLIPVYGRWDDLYSLFDTYLQSEAIALMRKQISKDVKAEKPSSLGKWLKSENASSKISKDLARKTRVALDLSSKDYRNLLTLLRKRIDIVEHEMSSGDWRNIKYGEYNIATINRYKKAFLRHDKKRFLDYINVIEAQNNDTKSQKQQLYPYDIIEGICNRKDNVKRKELYKKWDEIKKLNLKMQGDTLVCFGINKKSLNSSRKSPAFITGVSTALYLLENNKDKYKNYILINTPHPNLVRVKSENLIDRINETAAYCCTDEINVESILDLILFAAIKNSINLDKLPRKILFIFDSKCRLANKNRKDIKEHLISENEYKRIKSKWGKSGYKIPDLAFWRIDGYNKDAKVIEDNKGFQYAFGYSDEIFKFFISGDKVTSNSMLEDVINNERYKIIGEKAKNDKLIM
jgi:hypothetical protein